MEMNEVFKILSDKNRFDILNIISEKKEICACDLIKYFDITQATFSYHMKLLRDVKLVDCYKQGTWCIYTVNKKTINTLLKYFEKIGGEKND